MRRSPSIAASPVAAACLAAALALAGGAAAQGPPPVHAIVGARIVVAPGQVIESGTVVMRHGVLTAVGAEVEPPADARIWEGEGLTVYPGLIEIYSRRSAGEAHGEESGDGGEAGEAAGGGYPNPLITPERDVATFPADAALDAKLRAAGFTTALAVPGGGILRGRAALLNLGEGPLRENLLRRDVAQATGFTTRSGGGYPTSLMGAVALLRQVLADARWQRRAQAAWAADPAQERPPLDASLASLEPVLDGSMPVIFEADNALDLLRGASVLGEAEATAWYVGAGDEYQRLDAVAAIGAPLVVPVSFPEAPAVGEEDDLSVDLETLRHWDRAPENPRHLLDAGLTVAFTSFRLADPGRLHDQLARAVERSLSPDEALAGLTTAPARLLGISDRAGTVEAGKMANLVVVEGSLFAEKPKIRQVWIDGRRYEIKELKPPEVDPVGSWEMTVDAGGQQIPVTLVVTGEVGSLSGTINVQGVSLPLASAEVSGKQLLASFDATPLGMAGEVSLHMEISGDSATGGGDSPQGPFTFTAVRTTTTPPEGMP